MRQQLFDIDGNEVFPRARPASVGVGNVIAILAIIIMVAIMVATFLGYSPGLPRQAAQDAPRATQAPAPRVEPAPVQQAPIIVQQVPAGQAPQSIIVPQPAPVVDPSGAVVEQPAPRTIVIVHQVSGSHQSITGSGACKVARVAARCGK